MFCGSSYIERLLDRVSNGKLAEDRRNALVELQSVVAENRASQLAFGAMGQCFSFVYLRDSSVFLSWVSVYVICFNGISGFPVLMSIFKEERDDVEMVCK